MEALFIRSFWATLTVLWLALVIMYFILANRKSLIRKGYTEEYINYLRKSHLIRLCTVAVVLPLLILLSAWIVVKITGPLTDESQLAYIVIILIILVIPFKFADEWINQKRIRKLALDTGEKIAVDLNYKTLHLVFNPIWEVILGVSSLAYGILYLKIEQWIIYLFLAFPWFMYLTIRGTRYQVRPYLRDNYNYLFAFNLFSFLFFFTYFFSYLTGKIHSNMELFTGGASSLSLGELFISSYLLCIGCIIGIGLLGRVSIYIANYGTFKKEMNGELPPSGESLRRRMIFLLASLLVFITLTGTSLLTGIFDMNRTDVGQVLKKYIIDSGKTSQDTLVVIDRNGINYPGTISSWEKEVNTLGGQTEDSILDSGKGSNLKMYCLMQISKTNDLKSFEICCQSIFEEVPVATRVKFEYSQGNRITRIIDY